MARIWIPLADRDFDTTEVAVPWKLFREAGHEVVFATESGRVACTDPLLLRGVIFGQLGASEEAKAFYRELEGSKEFLHPTPWSSIHTASFDALVLPGGHAPGMRQYLESTSLQSKVLEFWRSKKPVGAICHGVIVLARTRDPSTGKSLLNGQCTTCLPSYMEQLAYGLTFWKLGRYYRTYPATVEAEVRAALAHAADFKRGPLTLGARGTRGDPTPAFVAEDGNYVSARWPGDAYLFAQKVMERLS